MRWSGAVDPRLLASVEHLVPSGTTVAAPSDAVAAVLRQAGRRVLDDPLEKLPDACTETVALLGDELSRAGSPGQRHDQHAEGLVAEAARVLEPGGLLLASARNGIYAAATGRDLDGLRGWSAAELARALGQRGFDVELLCAPGAAATLAGDPHGRVDLDLDRRPGLLDAAERSVAVGRLLADAEARTGAYLDSLPRKVIAAAVLCRDVVGRVLVVHDSFKRHWTIPGGVVDADEDPYAGAAREAWEETGVRVAVGSLVGVFAASWPDRLTLVYAASPAGRAEPGPVHAHEIDDAAWLSLDEALARLTPHIAEQVRRCVESPGGTWRQ